MQMLSEEQEQTLALKQLRAAIVTLEKRSVPEVEWVHAVDQLREAHQTMATILHFEARRPKPKG